MKCKFSQENNRCRHYFSEIEILHHVLGICPHGAAFRNMRHHTIRSTLAESMREICFMVYEEIHGLAK